MSVVLLLWFVLCGDRMALVFVCAAVALVFVCAAVALVFVCNCDKMAVCVCSAAVVAAAEASREKGGNKGKACRQAPR